MDDTLYWLVYFFIGWFGGIIFGYMGLKMRFREMVRVFENMDDFKGRFVKLMERQEELVDSLSKLVKEFGRTREYVHDMNIRLGEVEEKVDTLRRTINEVYGIMERKFRWNVNIELKPER